MLGLGAAPIYACTCLSVCVSVCVVLCLTVLLCVLFLLFWSNRRTDKWVPNMSAVNKSGKLNVNLCNFVPFVGSPFCCCSCCNYCCWAHCCFLDWLLLLSRFLNVSLFVFTIRMWNVESPKDNFCLHSHYVCVSLVVCQLSDTLPIWEWET